MRKAEIKGKGVKRKVQKTQGITLVALVVTIVVLLILAGITLTFVLGDNSVLNKAKRASDETKVAAIEEAAGIISSDLIAKKYLGEINEISMLDIISELRRNGYQIETREVSAGAITAISVKPNTIALTENGTTKVKVSFDGAEDGNIYYAVVDGKYYKISFSGTMISIDREAKDPDGTIVDATLEVAAGYDTTIVKNVSISENEITLTGGSGNGNTTLTIKYGDHTTTCTVKVAPKVTKITATAMKITEETNQKIQVTVEPTGATSKLTYSTTDTSKISVSSDGAVTAKGLTDGKIKDTATVTIKDELTGVTGTCSITIESVAGTFIEYDVGYTDMWKNYNYTKENGWRLLNYTKNSDGTYSNVELISTGVPAILYYHYNQGNNEWWVTDTTKLNTFKNSILGGSNYTTYSSADATYSNYPAMRASAGMYYNFGSIKFRYGTSAGNNYNQGYFTSITNGTTTYNSSLGTSTTKTGLELFKTSSASGVRLLTLPEVNKAVGRTDIDSTSTISTSEDTKGIYRLDQLTSVPTIGTVSYSSTSYYWVASPWPNTSNNYDVSIVNYYGNISYDYYNNYGVRPVVSLQGSKFQLQSAGNGSYKLIPTT